MELNDQHNHQQWVGVSFIPRQSPVIHRTTPNQPGADMRENLLDNLQIENKLKYYRVRIKWIGKLRKLFKLGSQCSEVREIGGSPSLFL